MSNLTQTIYIYILYIDTLYVYPVVIRIIIVTIIERLNGHVPTESQRLCVCVCGIAFITYDFYGTRYSG